MLQNETCRTPLPSVSFSKSYSFFSSLGPASSVSPSPTFPHVMSPFCDLMCVCSAPHSWLLQYLPMSITLSNPVLSRLDCSPLQINHFFLTHLQTYVFISELYMCTSVVCVIDIGKSNLLYSKYQILGGTCIEPSNSQTLIPRFYWPNLTYYEATPFCLQNLHYTKT